jgi:hypothetical protein
MNLSHYLKYWKVVELHLKTSQLLRSCNNLLSPVIFIGILLFLAYSCLWINLMIGDYSKVYSTDKILSHTGFMQFVLRNVVLLTLSADINTKATTYIKRLRILFL